MILEEKQTGRQAGIDLDCEFPGSKQGHLGSHHYSGVPEECGFLEDHGNFSLSLLVLKAILKRFL